MNTIKTNKFIFYLWIGLNLMWQVFFLTSNLPLKRVIGIEEHKTGGIIMLNERKTKVHSTTLHADLPVQVQNPLMYLLLTDQKHGNFISCAAKVVMWIFLSIFIRKLDLSDPFSSDSLKRAGSVGVSFMVASVIAMIGEIYTTYSLNGLMHYGQGFQYPKTSMWDAYVIPIMMVVVGLSLYRKAVQTQQEQDLTI